MAVDEGLTPDEPEATERPSIPRLWVSTIASVAAIASGVLAGWLAVERSELFQLDLTLNTGNMLFVLSALALWVALVAYPGLGLLLLLAVTFLNLSQVLVRGHGVSSLLQLLAVPLLLTAWQVRGRRGFAAIVRHPLSLLLLSWALVLLLSSTVAIDPEAADQRFMENFKALYICLLVASLASTPRRLRWGFSTLVACGAFLAGLGVWQVLSGELRNELGGLGRIKHAQIYGEVFEPRIAGPFGDPNYFAQILLLVLPFALLMALSGRARRTRMLALAAAGLLTIAVALTYSRGGVLTLACVLALTLACQKIRWRQLLLASSLVVVVLMIVTPDLARRLATIREILPSQEEVLHPDSSFEKRRLVTLVAWEIWSHNPVLGVGAGNYDAHFEEYANRVGSSSREYEDLDEPHFPHNLYLEIGAETGLIGFAVFGSLIVICFSSLRKSRRLFSRQGDEGSALLARGCEIALTGYLVSSLLLHGHFQRPAWMLFGMVVALSLVAVRSSIESDRRDESRVDPVRNDRC